MRKKLPGRPHRLSLARSVPAAFEERSSLAKALVLDQSGSVGQNPPLASTKVPSDKQNVGLKRNRRWVTQSARYIVGARVGLFWASHPFGRLSANRDQIVISAVFRKAALERAHVMTVYTTRALVRRVIAFRTEDGSGDGVFVYSFSPYRILAALEELGWEVAQ